MGSASICREVAQVTLFSCLGCQARQPRQLILVCQTPMRLAVCRAPARHGSCAQPFVPAPGCSQPRVTAPSSGASRRSRSVSGPVCACTHQDAPESARRQTRRELALGASALLVVAAQPWKAAQALNEKFNEGGIDVLYEEKGFGQRPAKSGMCKATEGCGCWPGLGLACLAWHGLLE